MFLSIIGSLELTSLVPGSWRVSASMVLQTTALAIMVYSLYRVVRLVLYVKWVNKVYGDMPGPKNRHWFFGSLYYFPKGEAERTQHFLDLADKYGEKGYYRLWGGLFKPFIHLCAPDTMKQLLKTAEPKPKGLAGGYRFIKPWLGEGLLISGGEKWARNRRLLTPAFHFDILKPYVKVYNKSADTLIDNLNKFAIEGTKFELFQEICKCSLDIILKCAFSYEKDVQKLGENNPYIKAVTDLSIGVANRGRRPYLFPDFTWNLSKFGRKFNKDCEYVHSVAEDIINKRRHKLEKEGEIEALQNRKYLDFLDILLTARDENGNGLTPLEIRNEVDTFLFEGHDTTASGISWILYSLAQQPEYQIKCQEEVDQIFQDKDSDEIECPMGAVANMRVRKVGVFTLYGHDGHLGQIWMHPINVLVWKTVVMITDCKWHDLANFEYLTMCVKEGMRLHCPVPMVGRQIENELDIGDTVLPKGTTITINIWALHHNKRVWENDMEFIPERFSKENAAKRGHYEFVPFSAGPRNCIGQHFALNEEKVVIAKLLRNFTFELVPDHVVRKRLAAVMRAENGIMMYIKRRQHS